MDATLRWLTNEPDPNGSERLHVLPYIGETNEEAELRHRQWLADKVIGDPRATEWYTVAELKAMGYVGVYARDGE